MTAGRVLGSLGDSCLIVPCCADSSSSASSSACLSAFSKRSCSHFSPNAVSRSARSTRLSTASFLSVSPVVSERRRHLRMTENWSACCSLRSIFSCSAGSESGCALCRPSSSEGSWFHSSFSSISPRACRTKGLRAGISRVRSMWTRAISSSPRVAYAGLFCNSVLNLSPKMRWRWRLLRYAGMKCLVRSCSRTSSS